METKTITKKMTVKDYLKKVENANEVMMLSNRNERNIIEHRLWMDVNMISLFCARNYDEFKQILKKYYSKRLEKLILDADIKLNKSINIDDHTSISFWID